MATRELARVRAGHGAGKYSDEIKQLVSIRVAVSRHRAPAR